MLIKRRHIGLKKQGMILLLSLVLILVTTGFTTSAEVTLSPTVAPTLWYLEPSFGSPGMLITIYADPAAANPGFGEKMNDDAVLMGQGGSWQEMIIYSWTINTIKFRLPSSIFTGDSMVMIRVKKGSMMSNAKNFYVRKHPEISSIEPNEGPVGSQVTISGTGFFALRENFVPADVTIGTMPAGKTYGYSSYIELVASNDRYRPVTYAWNATQLQTQLLPMLNLLDVYTGNPVASNDLYKGGWNVYVITDYFIDDGDGKYNEGMNGLDLNPADVPDNNNADGPNATGTGDVLLYRDFSVPIVFTVTD